MIQAKCIYAGNTTGTPDEPAGFPKQNLVDLNPDTYWKPSSATAIRRIHIDLTTAKDVDAMVALWNNNDNANHGSDTYSVSSSTDDITYTSRGTGSLGEVTYDNPILIKDISQINARYWRFEFDPVNFTFNFGEVWACRKFTISQGAEWPENDIERYHNRAVFGPGGRGFVQAVNSNKVEEFSRTYQLDQTKMNFLRDAFNDSRGSRFPLILQEGSINYYARIVRFAQDELDENQIDYQLYRPTVRFVGVPYIPSGSSY